MNFSNIKSVTIPEGVVTEIKQGNTVLWTAKNGRLPAGYQEVEWIQGDGVAFINTGIDWRGSDIDAVFEYDEITTSTFPLFGYYYDGVEEKRLNNAYFIMGTRGSGTWYYNDDKAELYASEPVVGKITVKVRESTWLTINYGDNKITGGKAQNANILDAVIPLHIFGTNNETSHYNAGKNVKLYSFKFQGVYEFVPCYKISDNTIGVYRMKNGVADAFLPNASTSGSFTKGNNVT